MAKRSQSRSPVEVNAESTHGAEQWRNNRVALVAKCHGPRGPKGLLGPMMDLVHIL